MALLHYSVLIMFPKLSTMIKLAWSLKPKTLLDNYPLMISYNFSSPFLEVMGYIYGKTIAKRQKLVPQSPMLTLFCRILGHPSKLGPL